MKCSQVRHFSLNTSGEIHVEHCIYLYIYIHTIVYPTCLALWSKNKWNDIKNKVQAQQNKRHLKRIPYERQNTRIGEIVKLPKAEKVSQKKLWRIIRG